MSEANEPPPHVVARDHREIWYAACRLLEENAGTALTDLADSTDPSDNGDDECENSDMKRETSSARTVGALTSPFPPVASSAEGAPSTGERQRSFQAFHSQPVPPPFQAKLKG
jgi:hypothetical protein